MRREHARRRRGALPLLPGRLRPHPAGERVDRLAARPRVSTIVETNLSLRDYRQNQVMKKVTSWAAIIAVPTLITGYYGMNVPYPGFSQPWGVVTSGALIIGASVGLYWLFRRAGWL